MRASFAYKSYSGQVRRVDVRDCPDVDAVRALIEELVESPVTVLVRQ